MSSHKISEHHHSGSAKLSDFILGAQDGLVSVLGLVLGLVASTGNSKVILAGGFATAIAETISMAGVAYTSNMAKKDRYTAELNRETRDIKEVPKLEEQEVRDIYRQKGFSGKILEDITKRIISSQELWLNTMMREELGMIMISKQDVFTASWVVGLSTFVGAVIPLLSFLFVGVHAALVASLILTVGFMGAIGFYKARTTVGNPWSSALKMIIIALGSAIAGYLVGLAFKV
jgi:VIT1/CCC1 family predicted Fe2+/Mn2+ transporter